MSRRRPRCYLRDMPGSKAAARTHQLLYGTASGRWEARYDDDVHPADILEYFQRGLEQLLETSALIKKDSVHRLEFVLKPVILPTITGYANQIGVRRETLWGWSQKYPDFGVAYGRAKSLQEECVVVMASLRAIDPKFAMFFLKNNHEWTDRVETTSKGEVHLHFDAADRDA